MKKKQQQQQQRKQTQTFCTVLGTASSYACAIV